MLLDRIPNLDVEFTALNRLAPAGWIIGANVTTYKGAEMIHTTYPDAWRKLYEEKNYFLGDPIALWSMTGVGSVRWSEVKLPDLRGVLKEARRFGLNFGVAFAQKTNGKRNFLTLSRADREFTNEEIAAIDAKFQIWSDLFGERPSLTAKEIAVLRHMREGREYADIARILGISEGTVRQRADKARLKLGASNRVQMVAMAVARNYLD